MSASNLPKYLAREDDGAIWSLNDDLETYSSKEHKEMFPEHSTHKYSYKVLIDCGFNSVTEDDLESLEEKQKEYHEYLSWASRSDGHGNAKGGTIEEFRSLK
jgi:hypothetical protein